MDAKVANVLSLEDQCFLHLVCHLEEYLPEKLASLPLRLRQKLLLNLPVADVFQLENTAVTAGIDMESTVWKSLGEMRIQRIEMFKTYNPALLSLLFFNAMHGDAEWVKGLLFSAKGCLNVSDWKQVHHHFAPIGFGAGCYSDPTPHRHVKHFRKECQQRYLVSCLVDDYGRMPVALSINCRFFIHSELWKERHSVPAKALLRKFLSRIETLELHNADKVLEFVLEQALSNQQGTLKHLKFSLFDDDTMNGVSRLLSPPTDRDSVGILPRVSAALRKALHGRGSESGSINPNLPYRGLSSIEVSIATYTQTIDDHLCSVIAHQNSLSSVDLVVFEDSIPSVRLVSTLSSLFHQPQFKKLRLKQFTIPGKHFSIILPQFLSAPSEDHERVLCFEYVIFTDIQIPQASVDTTPVVCGDELPRKALVLAFSTRKVPPNIFNSLLAYSYTHQLSSLTVTGSWHSVYPREAVLPTTTMLQHLHFTNVCLVLQSSPELFFVRLFQSPHIKSVHLDSGWVANEGLLPALVQGLRQQKSVGSLKELSLVDNNLAASQESELQEFFDVLFSLPQLPNLELDLRDNCLRPQHLTIMYKLWRKNSSQAMKQLKICGSTSYKKNDNECQGHQLELQSIADSGDY